MGPDVFGDGVMRRLTVCLSVVGLAGGVVMGPEDSAGAGARAAGPEGPVVLVFVIDGADLATITTAAAHGAATIDTLMRGGVTADRFLCTSPAPRMVMPDGSLPWGTTTSGNVAMHTGTHLFESRAMDDIFLSARRAGLVSVFAGGARNYSVFDTATHLYSGDLGDEEVVAHGLRHLEHDGARLLRLHLQEIRRVWRGPRGTTDPQSEYVQYVVKTIDPLLARLVAALQRAGVWERSHVILTSDHGMGQEPASDHPASVRSSWEGFLVVHGPGVRRGARIPYAELPDVALLANHLLGLPPLKGHLDEAVPARLRGTTATLLTNVLEAGPREVAHPKYLERHLAAGPPADDYAHYRSGMLKLIAP